MTLASASADASPSTIKTTVRQYIRDNFLMGTAEAYADDASFMDAQLLDSTGFLSWSSSWRKPTASRSRTRR